MNSPYDGFPVDQWQTRTRELIESHPIETTEILEVVYSAWNDIFDSGIGRRSFKIGRDLFPRPQIMAFLLHELIPLEFSSRYPGIWRREETPDEKDLVYLPDPKYSIEIKASSNATGIFGNRSYAQESVSQRKDKSGYFLAINFQKFGISSHPQVTQVRFGWLDHSDWIGQTSATGQQARLGRDALMRKLLKLPLE